MTVHENVECTAAWPLKPNVTEEVKFNNDYKEYKNELFEMPSGI